jgi:hypothetical protein
MPEVNSYTFSYRDVLIALVKQAGLHDGRWQIVMSFGLGAANMGPDEKSIVPGAAVAVTGIGLQRAATESPTSLTIDAAEVNPAST